MKRIFVSMLLVFCLCITSGALATSATPPETIDISKTIEDWDNSSVTPMQGQMRMTDRDGKTTVFSTKVYRVNDEQSGGKLVYTYNAETGAFMMARWEYTYENGSLNAGYDNYGKFRSISTNEFTTTSEGARMTYSTTEENGEVVARNVTVYSDSGSVRYEIQGDRVNVITTDADGKTQRETTTVSALSEKLQDLLKRDPDPTIVYTIAETSTPLSMPLNAPGEIIKSPFDTDGEWKEDTTGKWFVYADDTYTKSDWACINGDWYFFDANGYAKTSTWEGDYYLGKDGKMAKNAWIGDYYVGEDGKWVKDQKLWQEDDKGWKYKDVKSAWKEISGYWYYFDADGYMAHDTVIDGYTINEDGVWVK